MGVRAFASHDARARLECCSGPGGGGTKGPRHRRATLRQGFCEARLGRHRRRRARPRDDSSGLPRRSYRAKSKRRLGYLLRGGPRGGAESTRKTSRKRVSERACAWRARSHPNPAWNRARHRDVHPYRMRLWALYDLNLVGWSWGWLDLLAPREPRGRHLSGHGLRNELRNLLGRMARPCGEYVARPRRERDGRHHDGNSAPGPRYWLPHLQQPSAERRRCLDGYLSRPLVGPLDTIYSRCDRVRGLRKGDLGITAPGFGCRPYPR